MERIDKIRYYRIPLRMLEDLWRVGASDGINMMNSPTSLVGSSAFEARRQEGVSRVLQTYGLKNPYDPDDQDAPYADG